MSFARLLDQLAAERDRRAYDCDVALTIERIRHGGRPFRKAVSGLASELSLMVKSMNADLAQARAAQRQSAIDNLASINAKATEMASTGQLTGEQGALLDGAIARAADRIRAL